MTYLRLLFAPYTLALLAVVGAATLFPASGEAALALEHITYVAVALLFFFHGAKLSREAITAGASHWRLHLLVFACTFILFPLVGRVMKPALVPLLGGPLYIGLLYLCALPGTVQSAIAFTSLARGNVAAAVCSASASSLIGIVLTPLLLNLLIGTHGDGPHLGEAIVSIGTQLLLPFLAGHLLRPWIGAWIQRHRARLGYLDQGSILLVVYAAFSHSVTGGLWHSISLVELAMLLAVCTALLALIVTVTTRLARTAGFDTADEITIVFCGSKKSLATGVPMAQVLFGAQAIGPVLLPLMLFHQIQLMACTMLAQRYAMRREERHAENLKAV
ncbi:bile acid:sodium symporter [Oxalobacteraceae bacterium OM1]|nr:bile acid:sodium symporter [Oxalobacteraceae bacterium OM1]